MVTKNINDAVGLLHDIEEVRRKQMDNLLNEIDDHLTTLINAINNPDDTECDCCGTEDREDGSRYCFDYIDDDYCDECGELFPDDCVCEEDDYMDDDFDYYDFKISTNPEYDTEVVAPPLNAFARARWLNENH